MGAGSAGPRYLAIRRARRRGRGRAGRGLGALRALCALWAAAALGGQLRLQRLHELAQQFFRDLLQHSAAELGQLADDLQVGVDGDVGALTRLVQLGSHRGGRVAGAARLLALAVDDRAVLAAVLFDEPHFAGEFAGDRPDLDLDLAEVVVAFMADQLRPGH
jgi:hypothetical protein